MTTLVIPIRNSNAYVGLGKQTVGGTAIAPSTFFWWLDGSKIEIDLKTEIIKEGDGSRHASQLIKNEQMAKVSIVTPARPVHAGILEEAALGFGSDSLTTPTVNTTTTAAITANTSTVAALTATTGLGGSGTVSLVIDPGLSTEEIVVFSLPVSGSNLSVSATYNGGKFLKSHLSGAVIRSASVHTLTDQNDGDYFSLEIGLGSLYGGAGMTLRVRDCKVDQIKRSGKAGTYYTMQVDFVGLVTLVQSSPSTVVMDTIHAPFLFVQGTWTLDGATTTDALQVQDFTITQKNNTSTPQSETLNPAAAFFGDIDVEFVYTIIFSNTNKLFNLYFGGPSGTTDSQTMFTGSLVLVFAQPDGFHTLTITLLTIAYTKGGLPEPKKEGKEFTTQFTGTATSNQGANAYLIQVAIANTVNTAF